MTRSNRLASTLLTASCELILFLPREVPLLGHVLGGDPHVDGEEGVGEAVSEQTVLETHVAELDSRSHVDCVSGPAREADRGERKRKKKTKRSHLLAHAFHSSSQNYRAVTQGNCLWNVLRFMFHCFSLFLTKVVYSFI